GNQHYMSSRGKITTESPPFWIPRTPYEAVMNTGGPASEADLQNNCALFSPVPLAYSFMYFRNLRQGNVRVMIGTMPSSQNTRRWPRLPVDIPVRVVTAKGFSTTVVP